MLFAAPYANKVYGMEPDFRAFSELYWNVHSNDHLADKITVVPLCISDAPGTLTMHGQPGSSMSTLMEETDKQKKIAGRTEWTVECMTLDTFITQNKIDANKLVLKMDTEGAERDILRQLRPFIAKYKPSMLLSMVRARVARGRGRGWGGGGGRGGRARAPGPLRAHGACGFFS